MTTLKKPNFIGFFGLFHFLFCLFSVCISPTQKKKKKQKNAIFFSKTSFMVTQNFAKTLFWHTVTLFVFLKMPKNTIKLGKTAKHLDQFLTCSLDQFLTYKTPKIGPALNSTAYIYMLERHWVVHILASRELMGWPPWKLIGCPPFGGPFSHYKNRGFWGFLGSFLVPNSVFWVSRFCLISHLFFYFLDFF